LLNKRLKELQNMTFVSSPSSTNEVNTTYRVSTANTQVSPTSTQVSTASTQVSTANISDATVYAFLVSQPNRKLVERSLSMGVTQLDMTSLRWSVSTATRWDTLQGNAEDIGTKIIGTGIKTALEGLKMWKKLLLKPWWLLVELVLTRAIWQMMKSLQTWLLWLFQTLSLEKLIGSQISYKSRKGLGFVSYNVVLPPPTGLFSPLNLDLSYSGLEEFQQPEFKGYEPKTSKNVSEDISNKVKETLDAPLIKELVSDDNLEKKTVSPTVAKIEFVRSKQQEKPVTKPVKYAKMYRSQTPKGNKRNWNN
ncbi:hypothetical protein Tco_1101242, partial [Tanacetum coccineum]